MDIPAAPPSRPRSTASVPLRFEDVTQDGRLVLEALPNALAATLWRGALGQTSSGESARALAAEGIVAVLTRLRLAGGPGPFSANATTQAEATYRLTRADDGRFMLDMWADMHAPLGRTYSPPAGGAGEGARALAGRVFSEHVLTRPFAQPGARRVTSLDFPGAPAVAETRPALPPFESIATLPDGATPLEPGRAIDPAPVVFGVVHTDSNGHVNSLVYLRVFEEAALRRLSALGRGSAWLARAADVGYRKPCFAGQTFYVEAQAYEAPGRVGVVAALVPAVGARPHTYARLELEP